jgi:hypothetical protein
MGTQREQMKGVLPWMVCWASRAGTSKRNFCSALAVLVGPIHNTVFLTIHYFNHCVPIAQQTGQAAVLGRLSLIMRLYIWLVRTLRSFFIPHFFCLSHSKKEKMAFSSNNFMCGPKYHELQIFFYDKLNM